MTLDDYLKRNDLSLEEFAKRCGLSAPTILRARKGTVVPSRKTMEAIHFASNGEVGPMDLVRHIGMPQIRWQNC